MLPTPERSAPRDEQTGRGADYVFHQPLASSWKESLMVLPLVLLGAGAVLWMGHLPTLRQQARVEVREEVKAIGTTGRISTPPKDSMPVGTTGITVLRAPLPGAASIKRILPGDVVITMPGGSAEDRLSAFLESASIGATRITVDRIAFRSGSAALTPGSRAQIDKIATILRAYPAARVVVAGYTDNVGNETANRSLAYNRSKAVTDRLVKDGVAADHVHPQGFGSQQPIADNATENGRSQNRRVVLEVSVPQ
jgi:outer membrane protein OmpA-like peptidoglycan-associated protein